MFILNLLGLIVKLIVVGTIVFWGVAFGWLSPKLLLFIACVVGIPTLLVARVIARQEAKVRAEEASKEKLEMEMFREMEYEHVKRNGDGQASHRAVDSSAQGLVMKGRPSRSVFSKR